MPVWRNATQAVRDVDKLDIVELLSFDKPPVDIKNLMEAVMVLLNPNDKEAREWRTIRKFKKYPT